MGIYAELLTFIAFFNTSIQKKQPIQQHKIIQHLLNWINKIKNRINSIVRGIGAKGYVQYEHIGYIPGIEKKIEMEIKLLLK